MFEVGGTEILLILFLTLLVMGPKNIPKVARTLGKAMSQVRRITNEFKHAMEDEIRALEIEEIKTERAAKMAQQPAEPTIARPANPPDAPKDVVPEAGALETVDPAADVPVGSESAGARPRVEPAPDTVARGDGRTADGGAS